MPGNVGISLDEATRVLNTIREQKMIMKGKLSNISSSVKNLKSSWQSDAADNLQGIATSMQSKFDELETEVDGFATVLEGIIHNYNSNEINVDTIMENTLSAYK